MNSLVIECMSHGEIELLSGILTQERPRTLCITKSVDANAWQTLLKAMPDPSQVSELIVSGQQFDMRSSDLFCSCMRRMPYLQSLRLTSCLMHAGMLGWPDLKSLRILQLKRISQPYDLLMHVLKKSSLTTLHLSSPCNLHPGLHDYIADALSGQHELRELTLSDLQVCTEFTPVISAYAKKFLANQTKLVHLDLSKNPLESANYDMLWKVLQDKPALTSLSLACCLQYPELKFDKTPLARLLGLERLVKLDLSNNSFFKLMPPALMALASHPTLQDLDLHDASSEEDGSLVCQLANILRHNKTLSSLRPMAIDDEGCGPLAEAMEHNYSLRHLSMPYLENLRAKRPDQVSTKYPNYLALMGFVERNQSLFAQKAAQEHVDEIPLTPAHEAMLTLQEQGRKEAVAEQERLQSDKN